MKIGVISDTHGEVRATEKALKLLDTFSPALVLHCGDVGLDVISLFQGRPTHFVAGNMDDTVCLRELLTAPEHVYHDQLGELEIEGKRIVFLHGHDVKLLHHTIHSGDWDLVCYGHTHAFSSSRQGRTLVLNPGAVARTECPSVAVVELPSLEVTELRL